MSDALAVIHHDLMAKGGGEAVAMTVLEALQSKYDVTLFTLSDPDFDELNRYYNTAVESVTVHRAGHLAPLIHGRWGLQYYILQNALLSRYARRRADQFDLMISTINELGLGRPSVQYIHFPFDWTVSLDNSNRDHIFHPTVEEDGLYERLCTHVARVDREDIQSNVLLANSEWTADVVRDAYGTRPRVLYPPIDTAEFDDWAGADREPGFVTVGRIERSKRLTELIEIIDRVRDRGHDTHLHIVGPTVDERYYREVESLARARPHVHLEGELPREELVDRICSHRYGIHGKEYEHFGMAVAELAAGGTIPFVPATGGQHTIVRDRDELLYRSLDEAVEKIDAVLSDPELAADLRVGPREIRDRFGRERFVAEIRGVVADALDARSTAESVRPAETHRTVTAGND